MHSLLSAHTALPAAPRRLAGAILRALAPVAPRRGLPPGGSSARWTARRTARGTLVGLALLAACAEQPTAARAPDVPRAYLAAVPSTAAYTQVSAGWWNSCAVGTDGAVVCWGNPEYGLMDVPAAARSGVTQVSVGERHRCALAAGVVTCWGSDDVGQSTVPAAAQSGVTQVSVGQAHSCALAGGAVTCWGSNNGGEATVPAAARSGVTQISAGVNNTCAVVGRDGTVSCWGGDSFGQSSPPAGLTGVTQVSASTHHSCARRADGTVVCWGAFASVPAGLSGVTEVSTGLFHACAVAGGAVTCWGDDSRGQSTVPAAAQGGVTQVSTRYLHACAVGSGGTVSCWGEDGLGESTVPVPPPTTTRVLPTATFTAPASVTAGQPVALALTGARVPGHPQATTFTYAFDCGSGTYAAASSAATATCPTTAAGTLTVRGRVTDQDGDTASYGATVTVTTGLVPPLAQTVSFASTAPSPAYVGDTYVPVATSSAGLAVTVTLGASSTGVCTLAAGTVTFTAAGTCTLAADQSGNATYAAATQATQSITVAQRPQAILLASTLPPSAVVASTFALAATAGASGQPVVFATQTPATCTTTGANGTTLTLVAPGTCAVRATQAGNAAYAAAEPVTLRLTVLSAPALNVVALRTLVATSGVGADVSQGLTDKLDAVAAALAVGDRSGACGALGAFANQVQAQRGKAISRVTADGWLTSAGEIRSALGC